MVSIFRTSQRWAFPSSANCPRKTNGTSTHTWTRTWCSFKIFVRYTHSQGGLSTLQLLLEKGADVNSRGEANETPLHKAALMNRIWVMRLLLDRGVDINSKDDANQTPLHMTALSGQKLVMQLLLDKGADTNIRDLHNQTPFGLVG